MNSPLGSLIQALYPHIISDRMSPGPQPADPISQARIQLIQTLLAGHTQPSPAVGGQVPVPGAPQPPSFLPGAPTPVPGQQYVGPNRPAVRGPRQIVAPRPGAGRNPTTGPGGLAGGLGPRY